MVTNGFRLGNRSTMLAKEKLLDGDARFRREFVSRDCRRAPQQIQAPGR
jgi:hypothetical protein